MDISRLLSRPHDMNPGCAAPYLEAFAAQMALAGHTSLTISFYLGSAIHFGGWLEAKGLDLADIDEETIRVFGAHRCECPGRRHQKRVSRAYTARVQRFADFLRARLKRYCVRWPGGITSSLRHRSDRRRMEPTRAAGACRQAWRPSRQTPSA